MGESFSVLQMAISGCADARHDSSSALMRRILPDGQPMNISLRRE